MIAISIWLPAAATIALYTPMLLLEVRYLLHGLSAALLLIAFTVGAVVPPRTVWSAAGLQASHGAIEMTRNAGPLWSIFWHRVIEFCRQGREITAWTFYECQKRLEPIPRWLLIIYIYSAVALYTLVFQTYVRFDQCTGLTACALTFAKGAIWSTIWPVIWVIYLRGNVPN